MEFCHFFLFVTFVVLKQKSDSLRKNKTDSPLIHLLSSHNELVIALKLHLRHFKRIFYVLK